MTEIKKINNASLAKIIGAVYGTIGFFVSIVLAILVGGNIIAQASFAGSAAAVVFFHVAAGILFGVLTFVVCGAFGWIIGYVIAAIYNFVAKKIGGIKIEIDENPD
ncbi:MAG: hypothetical protein WCW25_02940 [Patescibacteria group bacterium]|jgi:hypothetical protein